MLGPQQPYMAGQGIAFDTAKSYSFGNSNSLGQLRMGLLLEIAYYFLPSKNGHIINYLGVRADGLSPGFNLYNGKSPNFSGISFFTGW